MEWPQIIGALLVGAGGAQGIARALKILRPAPPTVREFRSSELSQIQFKLAEVYENSVIHSGTLTRIESIIRTAKGRLDDVDLAISRLMDNHRELAQDHRDLKSRVERLEERDGPK